MIKSEKDILYNTIIFIYMDFIERLNNINSTEIDKLNDLYEELLTNHSNKKLDYIFYSLKSLYTLILKPNKRKFALTILLRILL